MGLLPRAVVMMVVLVISLSATARALSDEGFAVPLHKPSQTVNSVLVFNVTKGGGSCSLLSVDGVADGRVFTSSFKLPNVSLCVTFKCKDKSVTTVLKKSGCQYGDKCVKKVPPVEKRQYFCLFHLEEVEKVKVKVDGTTVAYIITFRLWNAFVATFPVGFTSSFSKNPNTCTLGEQTVVQGQTVNVPDLDECAVVKCTKKGLKYRPKESACTVEGEGCKTSHVRGCTLFKCARVVLASKNKKGAAVAKVLNSWLRVNEPSCKHEGNCLSLLEVVGPVPSPPPCSELACLEGAPGLVDTLTSQTGCLVDLLGDKCVGVGQKAGNLIPNGTVVDLDDDTCVEYKCKQVSVGDLKPVVAELFPVEYGCRNETLANELPNYDDEPFGCFRKGVITERNCTRVKCEVSGGEATITYRRLLGRCVDENLQCRSPTEGVWVTEDGRNCTCPVGGGDPDCVPLPQ